MSSDTMIRVFKHYIPHTVILLALVDAVMLTAAMALAWYSGSASLGLASPHDRPPIDPLPAAIAIDLVAMIAVGVYGTEALGSLRVAAERLVVALTLGGFVIATLIWLSSPEPAPGFWPTPLTRATFAAIGLLLLDRMVLGGCLGAAAFRRRVLVLGAGARARRLRELGRARNAGFVIAGFVDMGEVAISRLDRGSADPPRVAEAVPRAAIDKLEDYVAMLGVGEVVLALEERRGALPLHDLLRIKLAGVHVNDVASFLERETGRVDLDTLDPSWLIFSDGFSSARALSSLAKRVFDIAASFMLLVLAIPVIAILAVLIKLDSKGPVFFRQIRVGLYGQTFELIKLRSMRLDAEADGAQWARERDPRVTRVGRVIRTLHIDELPQVWNVLKGDMSFVGPRPERPQFVAELSQSFAYYAERHMVKPGITGWAQISFRYGASLEDSRQKLEYDLYYVKNYTPFLDLVILLQTLRVVLWDGGAR